MAQGYQNLPYQQPKDIAPFSVDQTSIQQEHEPHQGILSKTGKRILGGVAVLTLSLGLLAAGSPSDAQLEGKSKSGGIPHTGDYCASNKKYTKDTLKTIVDKPVAALLQSKELKGQRKFEASDVIVKDGYFYSICDSSWSILKIREDLPTLSDANYHIGDPVDFDPTSESGFEGFFEDATSGDLYVVREAVDVSGAADDDDGDGDRRRRLGLPAATDDPSYHAMVYQVDIDDSSESFAVQDVCPSEHEFDGDSKGFEGALSIRGADGVLYVLGLCEGNHCKEGDEGKDKGNGRVVVMARTEVAGDDGVPGFDCYWKTVTTLHIPKEADFQDYSAISLHRKTGKVVISSQENSQVWLGTLEGGNDGEFDPATAYFKEGGRVLDFPRNENCEVQYCNVEGVYWVEGGSAGATDDSDSPQVLVAVSDKMKGHGKQSYTCLDKDQSFHLFAIP